MNILMMTNTYLPHTGGVARSVEWFSEEFRQQEHRVLIVAPTFEGMPPDEVDVVRLPAIQKFNGSDFSVRLPIPGLLTAALDDFQPEIVHSHHPFLLGDTALRVASGRNLPIVFTHHTMYERYTHYVPGDSPVLQRFAVRLATEYANLCDQVIAPSESIAAILADRGVHTPIAAVPTGIHRERFAEGDGAAARRRYGIPAEALVVGHVGRLAPEKNLEFLARSVAEFIGRHDEVHFLVVGGGPSEAVIQRTFAARGLRDRLHQSHTRLDHGELADAYHAMDVFVFASQSETQGMVLAEAMTAGVPVIAVDAPGAREVVRDLENGRLLQREELDRFVAALEWFHSRSDEDRARLKDGALRSAEEFAMPRCAARVLSIYASLIELRRRQPIDDSPWSVVVRRLGEEWKIWSGIGQAVGDAITGSE